MIKIGYIFCDIFISSSDNYLKYHCICQSKEILTGLLTLESVEGDEYNPLTTKQENSMVTVISLGGSIVAPDSVDVPFIQNMIIEFSDYLHQDSERKLVLIIGGGAVARSYQAAYRELVSDPVIEDQDWIGIMATRINAELIRACFGSLCTEEVVTDPTAEFSFTGRVLVAAGWKPGFSTDYDAVLLARRFKAARVLNLSNISKIYSADPKKEPNATPLDRISWGDFRHMIGDSWIPGSNTPFDPVASREAQNLGLEVLTGAGRDLVNVRRMLEGKEFEGSIISDRPKSP